MNKSDSTTSVSESASHAERCPVRHTGVVCRLGLVLLGVLLLSLSYEPFGQFYLAWIAFVPILTVFRAARHPVSAAFWGWLGGLAFFGANLWWVWTASIPGVVVLIVLLSFSWAAAAAVLWRCLRLGPDGDGRRALLSVFLVAVVWIGFERLRAYLILGFPWLLLGHSQTTVPVVCQVADLAGAYGVGFWVMLINAVVEDHITCPAGRKLHAPTLVAAASVLVFVVGYGVVRMRYGPLAPGPRVLVVQPSHLHLPGGARTVSRQDDISFHLDTTRDALESEDVDLVVWSEVIAPPVNIEAREQLRGSRGGAFMDSVHDALSELTSRFGTTLVTGGNYVGGWTMEDGVPVGTEIRNSVYLYGPDGRQSDQRYDKSYLVRFAEVVPFAGRAPWARRFLSWLAAPVAAQPITPGDPEHPTIFTLAEPACRFVPPICLENIDPIAVVRMIRAPDARRKRVDLLLNLTNDGWFARVEHDQHLQAIILRSIENRVPTVRSSNTGISAFIDSCGRVTSRLPPFASGVLVDTVALDPRVSFYTRHEDLFAALCLAATGFVVVCWMVVALVGRRAQGR